jgi:hypothetical protein
LHARPAPCVGMPRNRVVVSRVWIGDAGVLFS